VRASSAAADIDLSDEFGAGEPGSEFDQARERVLVDPRVVFPEQVVEGALHPRLHFGRRRLDSRSARGDGPFLCERGFGVSFGGQHLG
jgi:hypothetical protein